MISICPLVVALRSVGQSGADAECLDECGGGEDRGAHRWHVASQRFSSVYGDLSQRQHSGAQSIRPVEGNNCPLIQIVLTSLQCGEKSGASHLRNKWFTAEGRYWARHAWSERGSEENPGHWSE